MNNIVAYERFMEHLARSQHSALLLDYDGTLAPFTADRQHAHPYPEVADLLRRIMLAGRTRIVLITGRPAAELRRLLRLDPFPETWGVHGLERMFPDGRCELATLKPETRRALAAARACLQRTGLNSLAEFKTGSIAVHWRGLSSPEAQKVRGAVCRAWQPFAGRGDLYLRDFDGGIELSARDRDKGDAVRAIVGETGDAPVAYLGDDLTDEDAFRALAGRGLTVLVRREFRPTAAAVWITPPEELVQFLADWLHATGSQVSSASGQARMAEWGGEA